MRLFRLLLLMLLPLHAAADSLYARLLADPASVDACQLYTETSFRELLGVDGTYFSQSVDAAYRRLATEGQPQPDFSGCWWRLGFDDGGFVMMQLMLLPAGSEAAEERVDGQIEAAAGIDYPLVLKALTGIGEAAFWSPLSRRVRWRLP